MRIKDFLVQAVQYAEDNPKSLELALQRNDIFIGSRLTLPAETKTIECAIEDDSNFKRFCRKHQVAGCVLMVHCIQQLLVPAYSDMPKQKKTCRTETVLITDTSARKLSEKSRRWRSLAKLILPDTSVPKLQEICTYPGFYQSAATVLKRFEDSCYLETVACRKILEDFPGDAPDKNKLLASVAVNLYDPAFTTLLAAELEESARTWVREVLV